MNVSCWLSYVNENRFSTSYLLGIEKNMFTRAITAATCQSLCWLDPGTRQYLARRLWLWALLSWVYWDPPRPPALSQSLWPISSPRDSLGCLYGSDTLSSPTLRQRFCQLLRVPQGYSTRQTSETSGSTNLAGFVKKWLQAEKQKIDKCSHL